MYNEHTSTIQYTGRYVYTQSIVRTQVVSNLININSITTYIQLQLPYHYRHTTPYPAKPLKYVQVIYSYKYLYKYTRIHVNVKYYTTLYSYIPYTYV